MKGHKFKFRAQVATKQLNRFMILSYTKGKRTKHFKSFRRFSSRFGLPIHDHHDQILESIKKTTKMAAELEDGTQKNKSKALTWKNNI